MKKYTFLFICLLLTCILNAQSWKLVWADEFNETKLDTTQWNFEINGNGGGNNELQYYTNNEKNIRTENGMLVIEALKENFLGNAYTSARINTKSKANWKYGKIEARMKLPFGKGIWPAFWMLGESISTVHWPACGEIDIMELIGGGEADKTYYSTLHWQGETGHKFVGQPYTLASGKFADDFHLFSTIWNEKEITSFCDSVQIFKIDITKPEFESFRNKFYVIFNLAVGGGWPGNPDQTTVFPQKMVIDYVRVYQLAN